MLELDFASLCRTQIWYTVKRALNGLLLPSGFTHCLLRGMPHSGQNFDFAVISTPHASQMQVPCSDDIHPNRALFVRHVHDYNVGNAIIGTNDVIV